MMISYFFRLYITKRIQRKAAVVAFYTISALAPLLVVGISVGRLFLTDTRLRQISQQFFAERIGPHAAETLSELIIRSPSFGISVLSVVALIFSLVSLYHVAYEFFFSLHNILADEEEVVVSRRSDIKRDIYTRLLSINLLIVGLISVNIVLPIVLRFFSSFVYVDNVSVAIISRVSLLSVSLIFTTLLFKIASVRSLPIRALIVGAAASTILSFVLDLLVAFYAEYSGHLSVYGPASYLLVLLLWVYLSVQAFLVGAIISRVLVKYHIFK